MVSTRFEKEYELHASQRILFPYLTTASGLAEWFADSVQRNGTNGFVFRWNGEEQQARLSAQSSDQFVRYVYFSQTSSAKGNSARPYYIEFHLENNELTDSTFLRIVDDTGFEDLEELEDIWDGMVDGLRKKVGG